jgi:hypothetical protein
VRATIEQQIAQDSPFFEIGAKIMRVRAINYALGSNNCTYQNVDDRELWPDDLVSACISLWNDAQR